MTAWEIIYMKADGLNIAECSIGGLPTRWQSWTEYHFHGKLEDMLHELTITVDEAAYKALKPMVEQQTIGSLLHDFIQSRTKRPIPDITALRGTLHQVDTSDLRDEADRSL